MEYRLIKKEEIINLIDFINNVYDYNSEDDLTSVVSDSLYYVNNYQFYTGDNILTYVCIDKRRIVGAISLQDLSEICFLFIDKKYLDIDIDIKLINIVDNIASGDLSINVVKTKYDFYHKLGFRSTGLIQEKDGNIFIPMCKRRVNKLVFNSYNEVVDFINEQPNRVYSLDNFKKYMSNLGNPQDLLKTIHIGGTNGKGSTTNYLKEVLMLAGYKVATFTSPPLFSRLDIIRINDQFIDEQTMVDYANRYIDKWLQFEISMFEIEVFIAIMYFIRNKVDVALFEVGLGGLLDATNIIVPLVALNTNIGLDHQEYLGDSYQSIAINKAGIIKEGIDYITGETKEECLSVFEEECRKHHSKLIKLSKLNNLKDGDEVSYDYIVDNYKEYHISLNTPALYQAYNSALALEALLYLKEKEYFNISDKNIIDGLYQALWAGRFEIINHQPLIIIDGAHNKEGIEAMCQCAKKYQKIKIIFSVFKDKDSENMLKCLLKLTNDITVCTFDHIRAANPKDVVKGFDISLQPDYKLAINEAFNHDGVVLITGSLYFISLVRAYIQEMKGESTFK